MVAVEAEKHVVELGSFSILNPKPPGGKVAVDGDFSVDSGNAATGAKLFKAKCASCHTIKEGGAPCGPTGRPLDKGLHQLTSTCSAPSRLPFARAMPAAFALHPNPSPHPG